MVVGQDVAFWRYNHVGSSSHLLAVPRGLDDLDDSTGVGVEEVGIGLPRTGDRRTLIWSGSWKKSLSRS
jgi:hypothetical protein